MCTGSLGWEVAHGSFVCLRRRSLVAALLGPPASAAPTYERGRPRRAGPGGQGRWVIRPHRDASRTPLRADLHRERLPRGPRTGQGPGISGGLVPAQSEVAGFYARPSGADQVQQRANVPTWSTLTFAEGGHTFSMVSGSVSGWHQQIDLHTGVISTSVRWTAPDGRVTDLQYDVFTDRARPVPRPSCGCAPPRTGAVRRRSPISSTVARRRLTTPVAAGAEPCGPRAVGDGPHGRHRHRRGARQPGRRVRRPRRAAPGTRSRASRTKRRSTYCPSQVSQGHTYTVTKYVGVVTSQVSGTPGRTPRAPRRGSRRPPGTAACSPRTRAPGPSCGPDASTSTATPKLASEVNASEFYLWSNTRDGVDWSISPAGLSSNGYDGHIFWDAETWMFPSLLAQHPDLAAGMNSYRFQRLKAAEAHARATGHRGRATPGRARSTAPSRSRRPSSVNSEGLYEQHITADIALAQWQYYLSTGDRHWLRTRGWPVLSGAARFWADRVVRGPNGGYHLRHITGPDEENPDVNDEVYTNVAAAKTLRDATTAARLVGATAPPRWNHIAQRLVVGYDPATGIASGVRRVPGPARQAGRRDDPPVPLAVPDAGPLSLSTTSTTTCRGPTRSARP